MPSTETIKLSSPFTKNVLNIGFLFGLFLAACCLGLSGYYLHTYLQRNADSVVGVLHAAQGMQGPDLDYAVSANLIIAGFALSSCGISLAMSFGFLGFCLFLIGVGGEMEVSGEQPNGAKINLSRMAPGVFVILCATLLAMVCVTRRPSLTLDTDLPAQAGAKQPGGMGADSGPASPPPHGRQQ